ncbi:MAG: response regulator transcription factor [Anaerolineae bacterium]|nr:response regulator transcription factor [Anaerolineae bacterium]
MNLRILVIGADPLARAGLARLLEGQSGMNLVGQLAVNDSAPLDEAAAVYRPDIWLWDLGWDAGSVPDDVAEADVPVVALLPDAALAPDALAAGARGLLLREAGKEQLRRALQAVDAGLIALDPAILAALQPDPRPDGPPLAEPLSAREEEVLQLLAEGMSNRAIAQALDISEHTVKFHVNAIMTKLDAQSRTEAVVRATRLGLILL